MRLAEEDQQHFPLVRAGGHRVCHSRDGVGGVALPSPAHPAQAASPAQAHPGSGPGTWGSLLPLEGGTWTSPAPKVEVLD